MSKYMGEFIRAYVTFPPRLEHLSTKRLLLCLVFFFVFTRLMSLLAGIPFYFCPYLHLDEHLCKGNILECLYYTHHKPPLFFLFLGLVYIIPPVYIAPVYHVIYLLLGGIFTAALFLVMDLFSIPRIISLALTCIFMLSPSVIAYENWLYYTYPCAVMLCLSVLFLQLYFKYDKHKHLFVYFLLLSILVLTRSLFHLFWFVLFVAILVLYKRKQWKKIVVAAALPFCLILAVYMKNLFLFGMFTASSQAGFELGIMTMSQMPNEKREELIREGKLSEYAALGSHQPVETYEKFCPVRATGIPILDQKVKSSGCINFNHHIYLLVNRHLIKDSFYVLKHYPEYYFQALRCSTFRYLLPGPSKLGGEGMNAQLMKKLSRYENVYNIMFQGQVLPRTPYWTFHLNDNLYESQASLFWLIGFPLIMLWVLILIIRCFRANCEHKKNFIPLLFMWITTCYISFLTVLLNGNNRHRFLVESFVLIFVGLFLAAFTKRYRKKFENTTVEHVDRP